MHIRPKQIDILSQASLHAFRARVLDHLRQCFPDLCACLGETGLSTFVEEGLARAKTLRLESEWEMVRYVDLNATFGLDFEFKRTMAAVRKMLEDPDLNGRTRITLAYKAVHDMPVEEAV